MLSFFAALFALSLCPTPACAQYRFDHWTADNGLPQNSVRDIVQTQDGYLWLTTFDGLVRFDGVRFTVFNKSNTPSLPSNRFVSLLEDRTGDLWATLETGEVVRRHQGRFSAFTPMQNPPGQQYPLLGDDEQGRPTVYYVHYGVDEQRKAYSSLKTQAYRWSEGRLEPTEELSLTSQVPPVVAGDDYDINSCRSVEGDFWLSGGEHLIRCRRGGGTQVYSQHSGFPGTQPRLVWGKGQPLQTVTRDAVGRFWLTDLQSMQSQLMSQQTLEGFEVICGYADKEGNYWFGTYNNGLFRARRQTATPFGKAQGLDVKEVYPMVESRDGSLWVGTYGNGLYRRKDGAFTQYTAPKIVSFNGVRRFAHSLYEDRSGQLWINGGWRLVNGRFFREPWLGNVMFYPNMNAVWTMCQDQAGAFWIGTDAGVARYQSGTLTKFTTQDGLAGNDTKVIIEDGEGGLWLGSYGGLTHYKEGKFTAWTEKDGLPGATVRALKLDTDGTLWVGTYDSGLGRYKDGRFTRYSTADGLFDNGVFQILEDDFGWLWMSCNRGIYRVRKQELNDFADDKVKTLTCLSYNKNDGLPSSECNGGRWPAGVKTRDGKLWFPTMGGIAMIDPAAVKANTQPPPVMIEAMRINNQAVPYEVWDAATGSSQSAIRIKPGQDNFEIEYTALSFINSENLRFRYKLEGADEEWVEAGTRRTAYFSYLSPGDYTFKVIAANADGVWNLEGASLRLTIVPPLWRTWWFLALAALIVAAAIGGIWKYREAQLKRVQMAQEAFARQLIASQEAERKRIAAELHDSLGQNLLIVKNRAQLGQLAAHDAPEFLEQFDWIVTSATQSIEEVRQIAQNLRPYHLDRLGLTKALEVMIEKVAATTRIRFVEELVPLDDLFSKDDAITLYRVVQESLNNLVKHAQASEAGVRIERRTDSITLTIQDNGRGFAPSDAAAKPSGFGLAGMGERVRMLGGELRVDSQEGQGTTVTIRLALPIPTKGEII
jgi:signal transduction histidine kinase/ligand-binding sensor domain-containing protein